MGKSSLTMFLVLHTHPQGVCVAGYGQSGRNEILQLLPPPTLQVKETQGLRPERDFKVECGGFSNRPVHSLKHVPDTSLLVTSGPPDSSLQVWQVSAEDSDVIKSVSAITTENGTGQPWAKIATISTRAPWVLHGSRLDNVQVTEVESRKNVYMSDVRKTSEFLASAKCRVPSPRSGAEFLCVSWAPALEGCLAVSGFDGTVHVYDTQSWDNSGREVEPIFIHKGHVFGGPGGGRDPPQVTAHTWHPQKQRTLLSAASDGSLHVWDWVQSCGKCG
ncbi:PREDICTED: WD repeat-containing protein 73 [Apaloderma vittatum]|uniref:WD repeat-containing protein 73 n=1 Tax=Apaloderma vittatum TaxID=57397 RepID=UPI000521AFE7|nr:PREDICTED: WD repeat-containing protein 73 [Apaloderma vittatum]